MPSTSQYGLISLLGLYAEKVNCSTPAQHNTAQDCTGLHRRTTIQLDDGTGRFYEVDDGGALGERQ
jgi:hypothetical protein